ncbi:DUF4157 domain-containing protein [Nitrosomonas sp.]|uniref:eCIS core domain-containing protein n=1 Tax=Nitrosomonas sp. TaxID=42353 RepID=UPI0037CB1B02
MVHSSSSGLLQRKCACGSHTSAGTECKECAAKKGLLQRKLMIGASNDPLEQEADRIADQVMSAPLNSTINRASPKIQRFIGQASDGSNTAPPSVERVLASPGRPLEPALRQDMEARFGQNFSQVRVHTGSAAEQSARDINASAYAVGNNVVFGVNQFDPATREGQRLLTHELVHVVQQERQLISPRSSGLMADASLKSLASNNLPTTGLELVLRRTPTINAGEGTTDELKAERERLREEMQSSRGADKSSYQKLLDQLDRRIKERGDSPLTDCSIRLIFDGRQLHMIGEKVSKSFPAVSGRPIEPGTTLFDYGADRQRLENVGPIPEGEYWIDPKEMKYFFLYDHSWGNARITIHPFNTTHNFGRGGFFIHGGSVPSSAGCIDLTGAMDEFAAELAELRRMSLVSCKIILVVQYPVLGDFPNVPNNRAIG